MKIDVNSEGNIRLKEIYNPIELVAADEALVLCQRDGVFEIHRATRRGGWAKRVLVRLLGKEPAETPLK